jgi:anti-sigma factor RsiW
MDCDFDKTLLTLWLSDQLTPDERAEVEAHLAGCESCRQELAGSQHLWALMETMPLPEPRAGTLVRFNAMLDAFKAAEAGYGGSPDQAHAASAYSQPDQAHMAPAYPQPGLSQTRVQTHTRAPGLIARLKQLFTIHPGFALAYSILLVVIGVALGRWFNGPATAAAPSSERKQLEELTAQVSDMRDMMMKSLLQNPSASERIRGVSFTSELTTVKPDVIDALLATLNNDPNVNVRLMTLEALTHYASYPAVRAGLVESISGQESPLVQAALADVMLKLQEKNAIRPFKKLLQQKDLNSLVRIKIETAIARLS